jgi:hypothetical protein
MMAANTKQLLIMGNSAAHHQKIELILQMSDGKLDKIIGTMS